MIERWKPVAGYEGCYEVSDLGRVRSLVRKTKRGRRGGGILKPVPSTGGYATAVLSKPPNDRRVRKYLHRLVLETFVGPCPPGHEACHDPDPERSNCRLDNLRWGTRRENLADKKNHGTQTRGEAHPVAKLAEAEVVEIRRRLANGETCASLARDYPVKLATIWAIKARKIWRHL